MKSHSLSAASSLARRGASSASPALRCASLLPSWRPSSSSLPSSVPCSSLSSVSCAPSALSLGRRAFASSSNGQQQPPPWVDPQAAPPGESLKKYCIDLTQMAREHKLDPVIGREEEMRRTIEILSRRTKNNPLLIGEPGVGKTAILEGLAQRIIHGEVPETIKNRRVLTLDLALLIAGASYRGEFEERLKSVVKDVETAKDVILFIDEIHTLVGTGASQGAMDASNILKPALARGSLHLVGATTLVEYRKYIEKDGALARRFQTVFVSEPTVEETISILRGLKPKLELHHSVLVTDSAVIAAATMSSRYVSDRKLPDKAVDLLDEACARLRMQQESKPDQIASLERSILTLKIELEALKNDQEEGARLRREDIRTKLELQEREVKELLAKWDEEKRKREEINSLKADLQSLEEELQQASRKGQFNRAGQIQYELIPAIHHKLEQLKPKTKAEEDEMSNISLSEHVTSEDVAAVVARHTNIPVSRLLKSERARLLEMETELRKRVVGQDKAVRAIANCVRIARAGLHAHSRPVGSFLFAGPSGTGKTELSKALAQFLFDTDTAMTRIDMSEYMESHSISRLIGAPPGYVGYEEGGVLSESVRRRPYQVILLDEVEKAHRQVLNLLLQVLDEGHLTDSQGRKVDFRNTIIILTSNLGSKAFAEDLLPEHATAIQKASHEKRMEDAVQTAIRIHFAPEFLNRLDETVVFQSLSPSVMPAIVNIQLARVGELLADQKITIEATDRAKHFLARKGIDPVYGARPLKRLIQSLILNPLAKKILNGEIREKAQITIDINSGLPEGDEIGFLIKNAPRGEKVDEEAADKLMDE